MWQLVYEDNFDGDSLNKSIWKLTNEPGGHGGNLHYYTLNNAVVSNGNLKIIAKQETVQGRVVGWMPDTAIIQSDGLMNLRTYNYTSSNINTKFDVQEGKFEARVKIAKGKSFFPAFWLYSGNPWDEIDIFEFWNERTLGFYDASKLSKVHKMNIHHDFDNNGETDDCSTPYTGPDFSQNFHTFTLEWEKDKITWLVDGVIKKTHYRFRSMNGDAITCPIYPGTYLRNKIYIFKPMTIIFNFAIQGYDAGSGLDNGPDSSTPFPSQMEVDWVRYYKKLPCVGVNVTSASQYPIVNNVLQTIVGTSVGINCNYTVQPGQFLNIIARDSVKIGSGFYPAFGSVVNIKVDPNVCASSSRFSITKDNQEENLLEKSSIDYMDTINQINVFPNPSEGEFLLQIDNNIKQLYEITVIDVYGNAILRKFISSNSEINIDLKQHSKGVYLLQILNKNTNISSKRKIIVN